jgi:hypothetical protein
MSQVKSFKNTLIPEFSNLAIKSRATGSLTLSGSIAGVGRLSLVTTAEMCRSTSSHRLCSTASSRQLPAAGPLYSLIT